MQDLRNFIVFLHGPSGSGKGVSQKKITQQYLDQGFQVNYISSGELYREAQSKPEIAQTMKQGAYFETLEAIIPGLQERYRGFIEQWIQTHGKSILILDGMVRRARFTNQQERVVPSQLEQLAAAFTQVRQGFSRFALVDTTQILQEVTNAQHLLIDIDPRDAERQMKWRANQELELLKGALDLRVQLGNFPFEATALMYLLIDELVRVVNAEITTEAEFSLISEGVRNYRHQIALTSSKNAAGSFADFFKEFGLVTELRDDDISPAARRKRIGNYVSIQETAAGMVFTPGFAAEALIAGLGYQFEQNGEFRSTRENCKVIKNGQTRGIELANFQAECESLSGRLVAETTVTREGIFGPEGSAKTKET